MIVSRSAARCRTLFLCSAAALSLSTTAAHAQQGPSAQGSDEPDTQEVVVTGTRPIAESEAAALLIQKNSDSLVAVVAADGVGRLPDQNVAQATSRLPGVAVERDQGQARYISLRGAPNYWTTLSFDGINVVSPEGRDARFDSVPSAIAGKIIVSKAVTPDMPGETVAGNVNVVTRSAFDYKGLHFAGKAGLGKAELGNRNEYEASAVLSNRFDVGGGEIGVLVSGSYFERQMITDNFENDYERVATDQRPGAANRFWVAETENKLYRLTRRNWSGSDRIDWKPDADNTVSLRSIYTIFKDDEARDNYRFRPRRSSGRSGREHRRLHHGDQSHADDQRLCRRLHWQHAADRHDLWHRHPPAFDAARVPPVDLHQHAAGHASLRRRLDGRLAGQLHPVEGRSLGRRRSGVGQPGHAHRTPDGRL